MAEDRITEGDDEPISLVGEDEPIGLIGSDDPSGLKPSGIRTFGTLGDEGHKAEYKRALNLNGAGATRCRLFHSKIALASLEYMENQINDWLDGDQIEIKHVGHLVGTMEGKRPEPNLLVMVWY